MSCYTSYDFTESLERVKISLSSILCVHYAWGRQGDYAEWEGGFIFELKDGIFCEVTGWCDTSGWGCQDNASVVYYDSLDEITLPDGVAVDHVPSDLNKEVFDSRGWNKL